MGKILAVMIYCENIPTSTSNKYLSSNIDSFMYVYYYSWIEEITVFRVCTRTCFQCNGRAFEKHGGESSIY